MQVPRRLWVVDIVFPPALSSLTPFVVGNKRRFTEESKQLFWECAEIAFGSRPFSTADRYEKLTYPRHGDAVNT